MLGRYRGLLGIFASGLALSLGASHAFSGDRDIRISGFSTLGYGILLTKDQTQKEYMGLSRQGTLLRDTKVGLNLAFRISDDLSFASQLVARGVDFFGQSPANNVGIFDWYFLRYKPNQVLELRAGRQPVPFSLLAETQDVGLVNPWVRPPAEVYSMAPVKSVTGVQARYNFELPHEVEVTTGLYGGQDHLEYGFTRESTSPNTSTTKVDEATGDFTSMAGLILAVAREDFTVQGALLNIKMLSKADYPVTIPTGQPYPATARAISPFSAEQKIKSKSVGGRWEHSRFLLLSEARRIDFELDSDFDQTGYYSGYYATGGLRLGMFMPTITVADYKSETTTSVSTFVAQLGRAVETKTTNKGHSSSKTIGFNTQLKDNVVWKIEYQQTTNHSSEAFGPFAMGLFPKEKAVTFSTSLDTVF